MTAPDIAAELGVSPWTSISGLVWEARRKGDPRAVARAAARGAKPAVRHAAAPRVRKKGPGIGPTAASRIVEHAAMLIDRTVDVRADKADCAIPLEQRRTVLTVRQDECHWPLGAVGTPEFFFCGAGCAPGSSYCERHARRARKRDFA